MKWEKKGLIVKACGQKEWMHSHIQNPFAVEYKSYVRVYFTTRPEPKDGQFRSVIAYVDLEKEDLSKVIRISERPVLQHGKEGTFDEHGVMPGAVIKRGGGMLDVLPWMEENSFGALCMGYRACNKQG